MATLRDIWTWPSNPSTGYSLPAHWSGDASYGLDFRLKDLLDGNYRSWSAGLNPVTDLGQTPDSVSELFSKYRYYMDSFSASSPMSFNKLFRQPVVTITFNYFNRLITSIQPSMLNQSTPLPVYLLTHASNPGWVNGDLVDVNDSTRTELNSNTSLYAGVVSSTQTMLYGNSDLTSAVSTLNWSWHNNADADVFIATSTGARHIIKGDYYNSGSGIIATGDRVRFINSAVGGTTFTEAQDTGTMATLNQTRHADVTGLLSTRDPAWPLRTVVYYTDVARTIPATLNESYYGTVSKTFTNSTGSDVTYNLDYIDLNPATTDWTFLNGTESTLAGLRSQVQNESTWGTVFARAYTLNITGGTCTTGVGPFNQRTLGGSLNLDDLWFGYMVYDGISAFNGMCLSEQAHDYDASHYQAFTLSPGASVTIVVQVINPARLSGWVPGSGTGYTWLIDSFSTTETTGTINRSDWVTKTTIESVDIQMPGGASYTYQDSSNVTQPGATLNINSLWFPGATSSVTLTPETGYPANGFVVGLNANNRLQSVALATSPNAALPGGVWSQAPGDAVIPVQSLPNQYVAPVPYAEDVWDTDDEWASAAFNVSKTWPTHVVPTGAKINIFQPSSTVRAQDGTKYVRDAGYVKYQIELTYPPMSQQDFRIFQRTVEAARGQTTPFYLQVRNLGPNANKTILFNRDDNPLGSITPLLKEPIVQGDRVLTLEGMPADTNQVFIPGEYITTTGANGRIHTVVNTANTNVFGEAKIRLTAGHNATRNAGDTVTHNPFHVVVTLAESEFEYTVGTDGLYRFSIMMDFDEFK